jgi:hypothetical protein
MAFSYDDALSTNLDLIRFLTGDRIEGYARFINEEINAALAEFNNDPFLTAGWLFRDLSNSPSKVMAMRDAVGGGISVARMLKLFGDIGDKWIGG